MVFNSWNQWFTFRRRLKIAQRICGIPFALASLPLNYSLMNSSWIDPSKPILGVDPIIFMGLSLASSATIGYLIGSGLPLGFLKHFKPQLFLQHEKKKGDFFRRIVKHRANIPSDPSKIVANVDFYGERINSIQDYAKWLRMHSKMKRPKTFLA